MAVAVDNFVKTIVKCDTTLICSPPIYCRTQKKKKKTTVQGNPRGPASPENQKADLKLGI
jgi:hypothetical protein